MSACYKLQQSHTGCVSVLSDGLLCPEVGRVGVSTNRSVTGCVPALGGGLPCPGVGVVGVSTNRRLLAVFRPSAADCHAPGLTGSRTGRSPAVFRPSAADCHAPESAFRTRTVPVWPRTGPRTESALLSRIRCVRLRADNSRDHWYIPRHQLQSRLSSDFWSLNFWSSNFWSNPTAFVGSPTAAQEIKS